MSRKESVMSGVRVLVGTRKGAFILTGDGKRKQWDVSGPHFAGWEIYHMKGSPADANRLYASQSSGWFGQIIQRSCDGGKTWETPGGVLEKTPEGFPKGGSNKFAYDASPETGKPLTTHQWYDGTQHPWEFKRVWHLEPSLSDPDTVFAGVEDAGLFRTSDGGKTWQELAGLRGHGTGPKWQPGAGGMCLHTILLDPANPRRMYVAISAAGAFRTDDGGKTWKPVRGHGVGGPHGGAAAARLLREGAARRDGRRLTGAVWRVLRHHRRPGVRVRRRRRQLGAHRTRSSRRAVGRGSDAAMIRVVLPPHLRTLAQVKGEVKLDVPGRVTRGAVLDALEERYPMLRGTIRDHVTAQRRPFLRFFACERDLTHDPPDAPLPDAVSSGTQPFLVVGAIAGG